jgi:hypothetical protein
MRVPKPGSVSRANPLNTCQDLILFLSILSGVRGNGCEQPPGRLDWFDNRSCIVHTFYARQARIRSAQLPVISGFIRRMNPGIVLTTWACNKSVQLHGGSHSYKHRQLAGPTGYEPSEQAQDDKGECEPR